MADEAVPIVGPYEIQDFLVPTSTAVEQGSVLMFSGNYAVASTGTGVFAGIAATEKTATDGKTQLGLWVKGTFDVLCHGIIPSGSIVAISGSNIVKIAGEADFPTGAAFGKLLETNTGATVNEVTLLTS